VAGNIFFPFLDLEGYRGKLALRVAWPSSESTTVVVEVPKLAHKDSGVQNIEKEVDLISVLDPRHDVAVDDIDIEGDPAS
jgi:hypothetical protein